MIWTSDCFEPRNSSILFLQLGELFLRRAGLLVRRQHGNVEPIAFIDAGCSRRRRTKGIGGWWRHGSGHDGLRLRGKKGLRNVGFGTCAATLTLGGAATPTERVAAPPKVKVAAQVANPDIAEARSPAKPKAVMTAAVRPPPANPVRAAPPAAARVDEGDGLYVAVLSTHKEAGAAQEEFAELQKKYAGILGSKQSEVQIISGQTGSWHRLVATPASTKAAANEICNDLRSAGYGRCWVKAY